MIDQAIDLREPEAIETTTAERAEFLRYDKVIERGFATFVEVGNAFLKIREGKLYRGEYATFDDYCKRRWGMGSSRARQLISAAETVDNLKSDTTVTLLPANESQARPLAKLEPDQQREAWADAVADAGDQPPTAKHVEKAAVKFAEPKPAKPKPEPEPVRYAPVWELERAVSEWLAADDGSLPDGVARDAIFELADAAGPHSNTFKRLEAWLVEQPVAYRKSDLIQAINNVREQRRTAQRQAQARAVYVEPVAAESSRFPVPDSERVEIDDDELRQAGFHLVKMRTAIHTAGSFEDVYRFWWDRGDVAPQFGPERLRADLAIQDARKCYAAFADEQAAIAAVAAEQAEEDAQRIARDATRAPAERAVVEVEADADIVTVKLPRELAAELMRWAADFRVGHMRLVDQAALEEALKLALQEEVTV